MKLTKLLLLFLILTASLALGQNVSVNGSGNFRVGGTNIMQIIWNGNTNSGVISFEFQGAVLTNVSVANRRATLQLGAGSGSFNQDGSAITNFASPGYLKSTNAANVPIAVATIPSSDITGLPTNVLTNNGQNYQVGISNALQSLRITATTPSVTLSDSSAAADQKNWILYDKSGSFVLGRLSDDGTWTNASLSVGALGNVSVGSTTSNKILNVFGRTSLSVSNSVPDLAEGNGDALMAIQNYSGVSANSYLYQGSAINARMRVATGTNGAPVGTVHAITAQTTVSDSGTSYSEYASIVPSVTMNAQGRGWTYDGVLHGPTNVQANMLIGIGQVVNNYNTGIVLNSSSVLNVLTKPDSGGGDGSVPRIGVPTYPLDVGAFIGGWSGTMLTTNPAYASALQIGGWCGPWMTNVMRSRYNVGILIRDYDTAGIKFTNPWPGSNAPAILWPDGLGQSTMSVTSVVPANANAGVGSISGGVLSIGTNDSTSAGTSYTNIFGGTGTTGAVTSASAQTNLYLRGDGNWTAGSGMFSGMMPALDQIPVAVWTNNLTANTDTDLYTCPAGRAAFVAGYSMFNISGSAITATIKLKLGGSYLPLDNLQTVGAGTVAASSAGTTSFILTNGQAVAVNANTTGSLNVFVKVIEFSTNKAPVTAYLANPASGANTLLTAGTGKTVWLLGGQNTPGNLANAINYVNNSGGTRTYRIHYVPSGSSAANNNIVFSNTLANASRVQLNLPVTLNSADAFVFNTDSSSSTQLVWATYYEFPQY